MRTAALLARGLLDRAQLRDHLVVARLHREDQVGLLGGAHRVEEEELQESLVARLEQRRVARAQPVVQRGLPRPRQLVRARRAPVRRGVLAADQALLLEPLQLRIDLPVARGPEEAGGHVDQLLDLVAGLPAEADHSEDDSGGGVHVSPRYIAQIYLSTGWSKGDLRVAALALDDDRPAGRVLLRFLRGLDATGDDDRVHRRVRKDR